MAIAFDTFAELGLNTATTISFNHTTSGTDRILILGVWGGNTTPPTSFTATYNGVSMTPLYTQLIGTNYQTIFYLINPTIGTNSVIIIQSGGVAGYIYGKTVSYTGVDQTNPIAVSTISTFSSVTAIALSITTTVDNALNVLVILDSSGGSAPTAGTGTVLRTLTGDWGGILDSGVPITPVGLSTLNANFATSTSGGSYIISIAPQTDNAPFFGCAF